jgi:hypothetical protein
MKAQTRRAKFFATKPHVQFPLFGLRQLAAALVASARASLPARGVTLTWDSGQRQTANHN